MAKANLYPVVIFFIGGKFLNAWIGVGVYLWLLSPCPRAPVAFELYIYTYNVLQLKHELINIWDFTWE